MITIESIRLRNFRSVREAFFRPLDKGITVIMGPNGAGKTTLLAGMLFALYGIRPPGSSIANLRRKNSNPEEECSVSVLFKHLGQDIEVIREIKGPKNRVVLNIFVDGVEATVTSVSAGDAFVRQRLGIDANSFLTAFAVRQKELDALVNATPGVRKQIIEKLAGIEVINEALKNARKNENDTKSTLETLPGSQTAVEEAESQVLFLNGEIETTGKQVEKLKQQIAVQEETEKTTENVLRELKNLETVLIRDKNQVTTLQESDKYSQTTLQRLKYLDKVEDGQNIEQLREKHKTLTNVINEYRQEHSEKTVNRNNTLNRNKELLLDIENLQSKTSSLESDLEGKDEKTLYVQKEQTEELITQLTTENTQIQAKENDLRESVERLAHSTKCPTCQTTLDNPERLIETLTDMAEGLGVKVTQNSVTIGENQDLLNKLEYELNLFTELNTTKKQLEDNKTVREELLKTLTPEEELENLINKIETLEEERTTVTEIGQQISNIEKDRELRATVLAQIAETNNQLAELHARIKENNKLFSSEKLAKAETVYTQTREEKNQHNRELNVLTGELASYQSRLTIANNQYKSVTEHWKRKQELLKAQETNGLTTELLDKFRKETIASLTPELSDNASELISDITGGAYTEVIVDDNFEISVMNSVGQSRTVGELSGGEESAVALALRLAIGLLITGRNPEFLWLDEVLTAQDTDRRTSMLETIRGLPYTQIIMVSHTNDAGDIADLAVTVIPDLKEGSTLEITSNIGEVGNNEDNVMNDFGDTEPVT